MMTTAELKAECLRRGLTVSFSANRNRLILIKDDMMLQEIEEQEQEQEQERLQQKVAEAVQVQAQKPSDLSSSKGTS